MKKLKPLLFAPFAIACLAGTLSANESTNSQYEVISIQYIENAEILSVFTPRAGSGVFISWAIIEVAPPNQNPLDIYVVYFGEGDKFPAVKKRCSFFAREAFLEHTFVAEGQPLQVSPKLTASKMKCGGETYVFEDMIPG